MLEVRDLRVTYGHVEALHGISLEVNEGEIVALVGGNGAGKSTSLATISGLVRARAGTIRFCGQDIGRLSVEAIVRCGLCHCPEGRRIFPGLTVLENLKVGAAVRRRNERLEGDLGVIFELFPRLKERQKQRGWSLSGGEQQMLAIGRALMSRPKLLMLDEPSLGLAPIIIDQMFEAILTLNRRTGLAILLVEQNAAMAFEISSRAIVLESGGITLSGRSSVLASDPRVREAYLGG